MHSKTTPIFNTKATVIEKKIPDITNLRIKAALNTKVGQLDNEIPNIANLATKVALNTNATEIENKIPDTTNFITSPELNKLIKIGFEPKTKETAKSFASKSQVDDALDIAYKIREKKTSDVRFFLF